MWKHEQPWVFLPSQLVLVDTVSFSIISGSCHKYYFCHNKSCCNKIHIFVATNIILSWQVVVTSILLLCQTGVSHDKTQISVMTKVCLLRQNICMTKLCLSWQIFVTTNVLLWQKFCCDHHTFVTTNNLFCHNTCLSWQANDLLCHDKSMFVMTNTCLSQQTRVCCNKTFVMTKMILVAAPTNDSFHTHI